MKYFKNVNCIEELKKQYITLIKKYHSDVGGSDEEMTKINLEYEELFNKYKNIHKSTNEKYNNDFYEKETAEKAGDFINIVKLLLKLDGINVELCGRWLWMSGNTKAHKDQLKKLGCKYSPKKKLWSWHFEDEGTHYSKHSSSMQDIRTKYGSTFFKEEEIPALA